VRHIVAEEFEAIAIGQDGEVFSWERGKDGLLGHGDTEDQPIPKQVEALRGVQVSSVSVGWYHAIALTEEGLVYAWGENTERALLGKPNVERELLPKPVEALRSIRVDSVTAAGHRSYAVAGTGELWVWGVGANMMKPPLGHGEQTSCPLPMRIESLRSIKVDAVAAHDHHTLALTDDGSVFTWGRGHAFLLGLGSSVSDAQSLVPTPQRIHSLHVACVL
jgi:alpha-tubulin suppressor-like RCC1 family protein